MFENVRWPGPFIQALKESAANPWAAPVLDQAGQPGGQALRKSRYAVGRKVLEGANVHLSFEDGAVGPDVWTAQNDLADEFDRVRELIHTSVRLQGECLKVLLSKTRNWGTRLTSENKNHSDSRTSAEPRAKALRVR